MVTASEIIEKYLSFFEKKGHRKIPNAPLVPENDPTALFISAGMQPLIPYLLGQPHPLGKRLASVQRCLRTDDIEEVGDKVHHTFFEMLGNWSLGDYFRKEAIEWSFEFLISKEWLGIDKNKLAISVFAGDSDAPFDRESYDIWLSLGISSTRIVKLPKKNNWWGPAGLTGPCGPDTEMFVWAGKENPPRDFDPNNPNWIETWNDVFMENNKTADGKYELLKQKNVDTGMGLERILAVMNETDDDYQTELYRPIIEKVEKISKKKYQDYPKEFRIITDHVKAAIFIINDGIIPSNKERGYVLRKLIRRAIRFGQLLGIEGPFLVSLGESVVEVYKERYPELSRNFPKIEKEIKLEESKFRSTLFKGLKELGKHRELDGKIAFNLYQSFGFPWEMTVEIAKEKGQEVNKVQFEAEFKKHQDLSRTASAGMFKGGLADNSEEVTKLHTATHLLHAALRQILGKHVQQKGSNITAERLRFDFSHPEKLTDEQIKRIEDLVNEKIKENLPVVSSVMTKGEAIKSGAIGFFVEKYGEKVTVYTVGPSTSSLQVTSGQAGRPFSAEICGGPHVDFTSKLKSFKIRKQKNLGQNLQRIYAVLGSQASL